MSIQSVSRSPWALGAARRSTAIEKDVTGIPLGVYRNSGSLPSRPIRTTRFSIYVLLVLASSLVCLCRLGCCYYFRCRFFSLRLCGRLWGRFRFGGGSVRGRRRWGRRGGGGPRR